MTKIAMFAIVMVVIWLVSGLFTQTVEPVVSSDVALEQMKNTTEGHVVARGYFNWAQAKVYGVPTVLSVLLVGVFAFTEWKRIKRKEDF